MLDLTGTEWVTLCAYLGTGIAMGFGAIGAGIGEGYAAHKACGAISRQPAASGEVLKSMLIGQAVAESASIFALVVAVVLLFTVFDNIGTGNQAAALIGAGIAIGVGALGCGIGCGFPAGSACEGIGRRPQGQSEMTTVMLIGQGVAQTPVIFSLVIALVLIYGASPGGDIIKMAALVGAGVSVGLGAVGPGLGSGYAAGDATDAVARWPQSRGVITRTMLLGQAVSQSTSIYALLISFLLILFT